MESKVYIDPYPKTMKMLGLERINIDCGNNTSIVTPANIAKDMVALLPDEVFIPESKFLDICCKSGIFLTSIREKLMNSKAMIEAIPDDKERYKYITDNQLYGIAPNGQCQMYSVRAVYGTLKADNPHILCFGAFDQYRTACLNNNHKMLIDEMKKEFNTMKFDVVIGNPPYNKDIYLDFVTLGHTLASKYDCWITPAKWQAKGGQKNEDFRKNIVPYMKEIVYYPDCSDIFSVMEYSGIAYYICEKKEQDEKLVRNISLKNEAINSEAKRKINFYCTLRNDIQNIITKRILPTNSKPYTFNVYTNLKYGCVSPNNFNPERGVPNTYQVYGMISYTTHNMTVAQKVRIIETKNADIELKNADRIIFTSDNIMECKSFKSYMDTKFIRYLLSARVVGLSPVYDDNTFRFVPAPEAFDHIFTDQELYKKYNLIQEEINIIESVIKERK